MDLAQGIQSALNPQGPHAAAIGTLTWVLIWGSAAIFVLVAALAAWATWGPRERRRWIANRRFVVAAGIVFPVVTLSALFGYALAVTRSLERVGPVDAHIEVVAHQWWWRVSYLTPDGRVEFETANEIRLPAGRPVELILKAADVIHSFWVPNLAGKLDMVPGQVNRLRVVAERAGTFRGQCAEYCGGPHAQMALYVIAQEQAHYAAWREAQMRPAAAFAQPALQRGRDLFIAHCAACHAVRGTAAEGRRGPDLTHVGSRTFIAAGILPNNPGNLAAWIAASQQIKPGNLMPSMNVYTGDELRSVAAWLAALR